MHVIRSKQSLAPGVVPFWIDAPVIARKRRPGQFVIVRIHERGERIPLTIADADPAAGSISMVVQAAGKTTTQLNAMAAATRSSMSSDRSAGRHTSRPARGSAASAEALERRSPTPLPPG
jgi:hypothetical protein